MKVLLPGQPVGGAGMGPLSPLEERLKGPKAAEELARVLPQIDDLEYLLRQRLAAGVAPTEFSELSALADACVAARETLQRHVAAQAGTVDSSGAHRERNQV